MALPHAYGRLQFGEDLDLHFRTLIGTGANPNVAAVVVIGIEDGWTKRVVDGIAKTGKPVTGFGIEGHGDIATIAKASYVAKQYVQMGLRAAARGMRHRRALGLDQVRRERHHHRPRLLPDRRQHVRQADPAAASMACSARPPRSPAPSISPSARAINKKVGDKWMQGLEGLPGRRDRGAQDRRPLRLAADQGQHRRRPDHHRGEGARQSREDRPRVPIHRRAGAGRGAGARARVSITWTRRRPRPNA